MELGWEEVSPPMEEARYWGSGTGRPCLLFPGKAIRWVPKPWGPRPIAKYGTLSSLKGRALGEGQGFLERPLGWPRGWRH